MHKQSEIMLITILHSYLFWSRNKPLVVVIGRLRRRIDLKMMALRARRRMQPVVVVIHYSPGTQEAWSNATANASAQTF